MALYSTTKFSFNKGKSDNSIKNVEDIDLVVDKVRRKTHQLLDFEDNGWDKAGFGDLDLHVRWNNHFDHVFLMRSVDTNVQLGMVAPTGVLQDMRYPASVPFGSNGHWGYYIDMAAELELKQDITLGFIAGGVWQCERNRLTRISHDKEPIIYSASQGSVSVKPGFTLKISPYLILGNLTDGLDFQVRYTYLRHDKDIWSRPELNQSVTTYLDNLDLVKERERLSEWRAHYVTAFVSYNSKEAMKQYKLEPIFFASYDVPAGGRGIAQSHQVNFGVELHF